MRRLALIIGALALTVPPIAAAFTRGPGDGTLVVDNAQRGRPAAGDAAGSSAGSTPGTIEVLDPVGNDGPAPVVRPCQDIAPGPKRFSCSSETEVRFRLIGGAFRVRIEAIGIDFERGRSRHRRPRRRRLRAISRRGATRSTAVATNRCPRYRRSSRSGRLCPLRSGRSECPHDADRARRRGRELDRILRRALSEERRLRGPDRRERERGALPGRSLPAGADRSRPDAPRTSTGSRCAAGSGRPRTSRS